MYTDDYRVIGVSGRMWNGRRVYHLILEDYGMDYCGYFYARDAIARIGTIVRILR